MIIAIARADGGVSIMRMIEGTDVDAEIDKWKAANPKLEYASHSEVKTSPIDRTFRDAWKSAKGEISVDMPKAREIHKDALRELRAPLLDQLDDSYLKALEVEDRAAMSEIAAKKQALRDVTADPAIAAASTPEELKAVIPVVLDPAGLPVETKGKS